MHQIWTFKFLEVARQRILGVGEGNFIYLFVRNLTDFPAMREIDFKNRLSFDETIAMIG